MSEVDGLSNSGLYPVLPIADKRPDRDGSGSGKPSGDPHASAPESPDDPSDRHLPPPPKSIIDEYA